MKTKTAASFKLSKTSKRALATLGQGNRGEIKNIFIDAEVAGAIKPKSTKDNAPGGR